MKKVIFVLMLIFPFLSPVICEDDRNIVLPPNAIAEETSEERIGEERIIGGSVAPLGRYPYMAALIDCNGDQFCGGTLVAPQWVLSAAHCVGSASHVHVGRNDLSEISGDYEIHEVDFEKQHPLYGASLFGDYNNDYMLIKLKTQSSITPVQLNDGSVLRTGTKVTAMGWGLILPATVTFGVPFPSSKLREVELNVVGNAICSVSYPFEITRNMICAAGILKDSCQGDSGGPLIIKGSSSSGDNNSTDVDIQVGIVSWGSGCANPLFPGVYARVSTAIDWINGEIDKKDESFLQDRMISKFRHWLVINNGKSGLRGGDRE